MFVIQKMVWIRLNKNELNETKNSFDSFTLHLNGKKVYQKIQKVLCKIHIKIKFTIIRLFIVTLFWHGNEFFYEKKTKIYC